MTDDNTSKTATKDYTSPEHMGQAIEHVSSAVESGHIAIGAAKGLIFSIMETLGVMMGDPDLPEHARSGYEGLLETARELRVRIEQKAHH
jgi:hypothetical protein